MTKKEKIKFAYLTTYISLIIIGTICLGIFAKTQAGLTILICLIVFAIGALIGFIVLHNLITYYYCEHCKKEFKAKFFDTIMGNDRGVEGKKLTCPHCNEKDYCKVIRDK